MKTPFIFHQNKKQTVTIPCDWNLVTYTDFDDTVNLPDITELTRNALKIPVGSPRLNEVLSSQAKIAILIEDITRPAPQKEILTVLLDELKNVGIIRENISIIIALGTHRVLTPDELENTFGRNLLSRYTFICHDCNADDLVVIGKLRNGFPVRINHHVYDADFKIGIGTIAPHPLSGFGGGGKILFPGVADSHSILEHHLNYAFAPGSGLGKITNNPFYEEIVSITRAAKLDFIINCIIDQRDQTAAMIAGDPIYAHRAGIKICQKLISCTFPCQADVTLTTSFPYKQGAQFIKALAPAAQVTKMGGSIILTADIETIPALLVESLAAFHAAYKGNLLKELKKHFDSRHLLVEKAAIDYNMAIGFTLTMQDQFDIILISDNVAKANTQKMGFIYAENIADAIQFIQMKHHRPDVHVIPSGGIMLPALHSP
ncbi:nickel-dependent lactate racemase [Desulfococcaceae bacterium HSG7]|nr:nickel-dependent lactate racemase [Desulfococcaceae bacterium HSG7]